MLSPIIGSRIHSVSEAELSVPGLNIEKLKSLNKEAWERAHESDICLVFRTMHQGICSEFYSEEYRMVQKRISTRLAELERLSNRMQKQLSAISAISIRNGRSLNEMWNMRTFGSAFRIYNGEMLSWPTSNHSLSRAIGALSELVHDELALRREETKTHRPKRQILDRLAEQAVFGWIGAKLVAGERIANAIPSGSNGGFRWCEQVLRIVVDQYSSSELNLKKWKSSYLDHSFRRAVAAIRKKFDAFPLAENTEQWSSIGWDSVVGLELLSMATAAYSFEEVSDSSVAKLKHRRAWFEYEASITSSEDYALLTTV